MPAPRIAAHMIENVSWETFRGRSAATMPPSRLPPPSSRRGGRGPFPPTRSCPALLFEDAFATAGAHALHFRQSHPVLGLRLQQLREDPAKPVTRLDVASGQRLDGTAHARAGIGEGDFLRPAPLEDHLLADVERIFAEGQALRDLLGEDHPLAEEEAVARIRHDALVEL